MKKVYLVLTLLMTSLFFFSTNEVRADTVYTVNSSDFDYINDDFLKMRELAIEYCNENNTYYLIQYKNSSLQVAFFEKTIDIYFTYINANGRIYLRSTGSDLKIYKGTTNLWEYGSSSGFSDYISSGSTLSYAYFLDTNIENLLYTGSKSFTITYNDLSYLVEQNTVMPSLYQIYLDDTVEDVPPEVPVVENEVIANYYSTVISKIGYLVETISSNQVYLSVIVIFLLIFITELIFRRFI